MQRAVSWRKEYGLQFDAINENPPETIALYGGDSQKITADYYIDDRCILPQDTIQCLA